MKKKGSTMRSVNKAPVVSIRLSPSCGIFGAPLRPRRQAGERAAAVGLAKPGPVVAGESVASRKHAVTAEELYPARPSFEDAADMADDAKDATETAGAAAPAIGPRRATPSVARPKPTGSFAATVAHKAGVSEAEASVQIAQLAKRLGCSELTAATLMMGRGVRTRQIPPKVRSSGAASEDDFVTAARRLAAERGLRVDQAMSQIARERPALHAEYVAQCRRR